jgi:prepilin-type N-terminal cleavage/methylation domain-containing protein
MKNKIKGFTLIELLIVIGIIAILAAAIIVAITPGQRLQDARDATMESHQQAIGTAVHLTILDNEYADMDAFFAATGCTDTGLISAGTPTCSSQIGLPSVPVPPGGGTGYTLTKSGDYRVTVKCQHCTDRTF